jgi:hypothetical protein
MRPPRPSEILTPSGFVSLLVGLAGAAPAALSARGLPRPPPDLVQLGKPTGTVYGMTVTTDASAWREVVSSESRHCRVESRSGRFAIVGGRSFVVVHPAGNAYVRTGSNRFLGHYARYCTTTESLVGRIEASGPVHVGDLLSLPGPASAVIDQKLPAEDALRAGLFSFDRARIGEFDLEGRLGAPPRLPIRPYWFGRLLGERRAVDVIEHYGLTHGIVYSVNYVPASAGGVSSAIPGQRPRGQVQVVNERKSASPAKRAIRVFNGRNGDLRYRPWPRQSVRLANGERATLVPHLFEGGPWRTSFSVVTRRTLVHVVGGPWGVSFAVADMPRLARRLRPVPTRGPAGRSPGQVTSPSRP